MGDARNLLFRTVIGVACVMTVTGLLAATLSAGESDGQPPTATPSPPPGAAASPPPVERPAPPETPTRPPSLPAASEPPAASALPDHPRPPETAELELPPISGLPRPALPRDQAGQETGPIGPPPRAGNHGASGEALRRIRRALQGQANAATTGDPILDDLLEHLSGRKSVLEGSSLDGVSAEPTSATAVRSSGRAGAPTRSRAARAAEQLLKAARILESLGPADASRTKLVTRMRNEAVQLLSPKVQSESVSAGE